jgi:hypothetical protein
MASGVRVRTIATAANELGLVLYCATHEGNDPNGPAGSIPVGVTKKPKRKTKRKIAR